MWQHVRKYVPFLRAPEEKSVLEQQRELIDLAEEFDRLTTFPAWLKALRHMGDDVNSALIEATKHKENPELMAVYVTRWDAKRELLDALQGWINGTLTERDRIVEEIRETQNEQLANAH